MSCWQIIRFEPEHYLNKEKESERKNEQKRERERGWKSEIQISRWRSQIVRMNSRIDKQRIEELESLDRESEGTAVGERWTDVSAIRVLRLGLTIFCPLWSWKVAKGKGWNLNECGGEKKIYIRSLCYAIKFVPVFLSFSFRTTTESLFVRYIIGIHFPRNFPRLSPLESENFTKVKSLFNICRLRLLR